MNVLDHSAWREVGERMEERQRNGRKEDLELTKQAGCSYDDA